MKKRVNYMILLAAALLTLTLPACVDDNPAMDKMEDDAVVQLILKMPGAGSGGATRSISPTPGDENRIDLVQVLAFTQNAANDWVYRYTATGVSINPTTGGGANDMTVMAKVMALKQPQRFVILANSAAELAVATLVPGKKLADIKREIVCSTGSGEWPAHNNGSGGFTPFPMYAVTTPEIVDSGTNYHIGTYPMIRMVARIDVALHSSISPGDFKLEDACLFNYKTAGYVTYFDTNFLTDRVTAPAVPAAGDHSGAPILLPTVHYMAGYGTDPRGKIACSIYTFESEAITSQADKTKKTALVIGGYYQGASTKTYYRIDLKSKTDFSPNISSGILRNHLYKVEVQHIAGEGYPTDEDAYMGDCRLTAEVTPWNLADQNIIVDRQFYLNVVPESDGIIKKWELDSLLNVKAGTNYDITSRGFPKGIWIDISQVEYDPAVTPADAWVTLTNLSGGTDGNLTREFVLELDRAKIPVDTYAAIAKVPIRAGNLTHIINITYINEYYPEVHKGWAGCNIYWNGTNLTFDDVGDHTKSRYQGLHFQWGSLYGISTMGAYGPAIPLYTPVPSKETAGSLGFGTWDTAPRAPEIPIINHPPPGKTVFDRAYLYEIDTRNGTTTGIGDICKYMTERGWTPSGKWRMPTAWEIGLTGGAYTVATAPPWYWTAATKDDGTYLVTNGSVKTDTGTPFFPASSYRNYKNDYSWYRPGRAMHYWGSTVTEGSNYRAYSIQSDGATYVEGESRRMQGFSVRCVKD